MEIAIRELGITEPGTYCTDGSYVIDLADDEAFAKMYSRLENKKNDNLEYIESISTLNTHTGNFSYLYKDNVQLTLIADWDNDEYKLVVRENN